jgi:hypothetical protein
MEKKIYVAPHTEVMEVEAEMLLSISTQDEPGRVGTFEGENTDEVEVLSKGRYEW